MAWKFWRAADRVQPLVSAFRHADDFAWQEACDAMGEAIASKLDEREIRTLLEALAAIEPVDDDHDAQASILASLASRARPRASYVWVLEEQLPKLREGARTWAMELLARCPGGWDAVIRAAPTVGMLGGALDVFGHADYATTREQRAQLLQLAASGALADEVARLVLLGWLPTSKISPRELAPHARAFLAGYRAALARRTTAATDEARASADQAVGVYLDLFRYLPPEVCADDLDSAARTLPAELGVFAAAALVCTDRDLPAGVLEAIAAQDYPRWILYQLLAKDGREARIPPAWRTQLALARADLANWCRFPTELDKAPDEMELMKVIEVEDSELYVFRFRTHPPHWAAETGWIAGIAGPYPRHGGPHLHGSHTFSAFKPPDERSAEEHAGDVQAILATWRQAHGA